MMQLHHFYIRSRIQKFNGNGIFPTKWGNKGSGDGELESPTGVACDARGILYVADLLNYLIQKFR